MDWKSPFIVYRITPEGKLEEVFHAEDIKKAKYWLSYIAQPGDVLCRTPAHPKHSKQTALPEYWSHKEHGGISISNQSEWENYLKSINLNVEFPKEQIHIPQ